MDRRSNSSAQQGEPSIQDQPSGTSGGYYEYAEEGSVYVKTNGQVDIDDTAVIEQGGYVDADGNFISTEAHYYEEDEALVDEQGRVVLKAEYSQYARPPPPRNARSRYSDVYSAYDTTSAGSSRGPPQGGYAAYGGVHHPSPRRQLYQAPPVATPNALAGGRQYAPLYGGPPPRAQRFPGEYRQPIGRAPGMEPGYRGYYDETCWTMASRMTYVSSKSERESYSFILPEHFPVEQERYVYFEDVKPMSSSRPLGNIANMSGSGGPPLASQLGFPRSALAAAAPSSYTGGSILTSFLGTSKAASKLRKASSKKKPCNCTKSMCLKLYCDCFANGEFCLDCNCRDCHNNLEHESERSKAIKSSLERNPTAFKPKIGVSAKVGKNVDMERLHQKGCHCKKSNCLKNYCECYEAKVPCTDRCKCVSCRNTEHDRHHKYKDKFSTTAGGLAQLAAAAAADARSSSPFSDDDDDACGGGDAPNPKTQPWFYLTEDVTEAITMCLVAHAQELEESGVPDEALEQGILGEFGRCLEQLIENAKFCQQTIIA